MTSETINVWQPLGILASTRRRLLVFLPRDTVCYLFQFPLVLASRLSVVPRVFGRLGTSGLVLCAANRLILIAALEPRFTKFLHAFFWLYALLQRFPELVPSAPLQSHHRPFEQAPPLVHFPFFFFMTCSTCWNVGEKRIFRILLRQQAAPAFQDTRLPRPSHSLILLFHQINEPGTHLL